jgi:hypothetical protein
VVLLLVHQELMQVMVQIQCLVLLLQLAVELVVLKAHQLEMVKMAAQVGAHLMQVQVAQVLQVKDFLVVMEEPHLHLIQQEAEEELDQLDWLVILEVEVMVELDCVQQLLAQEFFTQVVEADALNLEYKA